MPWSTLGLLPLCNVRLDQLAEDLGWWVTGTPSAEVVEVGDRWASGISPNSEQGRRVEGGCGLDLGTKEHVSF